MRTNNKAISAALRQVAKLLVANTRYTNKFDFQPGRIYSYEELPEQVQSDINDQFDDPEEIDEFDFKAVLLTPSEIAEMTEETGDNAQWILHGWKANTTDVENIEDLDDPETRARFLDAIPSLARVMESIKTSGLDYPSVGREGTHRAIAHYLLGRSLPYLEIEQKLRSIESPQ